MTPSMTAVPDTRVLSFQMCGGNSGLAALLSRAEERHQQDRRGGERDQHAGGEPAVLLGGAEAVDEGGEAADDGGGAGEVELLEGDARGGGGWG